MAHRDEAFRCIKMSDSLQDLSTEHNTPPKPILERIALFISYSLNAPINATLRVEDPPIPEPAGNSE